jgi:hypothetical protein
MLLNMGGTAEFGWGLDGPRGTELQVPLSGNHFSRSTTGNLRPRQVVKA